MAEEPAPDAAPQSSPEPTPQTEAQVPQPAAAQPVAPVEPAESADAAPPAAAPQAPVETVAAAAAADPQAAADDAPIDQESIDALLKQANFESPDAHAAESAGGPSIEELLQQANFEDTANPVDLPGSEAEGFKLPSFQQVMADAQVSSIDLLRDVELNVKIELGRSRMLVEEVLQLSEGSVVELDKLAGDPVDVFVNDKLVARGEVLVLNDNFCVRVNEIVPVAQEEAM